MAKEKSKKENSNKVTFGVRRKGKHRKSNGPKDKSVKPYRGQGR